MIAPVRRSDRVAGGRLWREAEAALYRTASALAQGRFPPLDAVDGGTARRLGYLAEALALMLGAGDRDGLLRYAATARVAAENRLGRAEDWPVEPFVPGPPARGPAALDDLAMAWRFDPGLDVSRLRAEGWLDPDTPDADMANAAAAQVAPPELATGNERRRPPDQNSGRTPTRPFRPTSRKKQPAVSDRFG